MTKATRERKEKRAQQDHKVKRVLLGSQESLKTTTVKMIFATYRSWAPRDYLDLQVHLDILVPRVKWACQGLQEWTGRRAREGSLGSLVLQVQQVLKV